MSVEVVEPAVEGRSVVRALACGDCGPGAVVEVGVEWPLLGLKTPADRPSGAFMCRACSRFLGWVA